MYEGLERPFLKRIFQFVQYFIYFLWAIILLTLYPKAILQGIFHIILILILFAYVVIFMPALTLFWKYEQIGIHFLLLLVQVLIAILLFDDGSKYMSGLSRFRMGYAIAFFSFLIFFWNMCVLIWKLIEFFLKCSKAKKLIPHVGGLHVDNDYEQTGTRYVQNVQGDYELIERDDIKHVKDSNQANLNYFDADLDRQMKSDYVYHNTVP